MRHLARRLGEAIPTETCRAYWQSRRGYNCDMVGGRARASVVVRCTNSRELLVYEENLGGLMRKTYSTPTLVLNGGVVCRTLSVNSGSGEAAGKLPEAGGVGFHL